MGELGRENEVWRLVTGVRGAAACQVDSSEFVCEVQNLRGLRGLTDLTPSDP